MGDPWARALSMATTRPLGSSFGARVQERGAQEPDQLFNWTPDSQKLNLEGKGWWKKINISRSDRFPSKSTRENHIRSSFQPNHSKVIRQGGLSMPAVLGPQHWVK